MTENSKTENSNWFQKILPAIKTNNRKTNVPQGVWMKCPSCGEALYQKAFEENLHVCHKCDHHERISARKRLAYFLDEENQQEIAANITPVDGLNFFDSKPYSQRLEEATEKSQEKDALVVIKGQVCSIPIVVAAFEFNFMGGSMGAVVGGRFVKAVETSLEQNIPLITFTASGGARMQEGLFSLMQMAKTSAALKKLSNAKIPYIVVLTDPTMGGVSASLATLGDIHLAEPNALIGFAGPRVIEQTVRQKLPKGFQRSEFLLEHGLVDMIVHRRDMRCKVAKLLAMLSHNDMPECPDSVVEPAENEETA